MGHSTGHACMHACNPTDSTILPRPIYGLFRVSIDSSFADINTSIFTLIDDTQTHKLSETKQGTQRPLIVYAYLRRVIE